MVYFVSGSAPRLGLVSHQFVQPPDNCGTKIASITQPEDHADHHLHHDNQPVHQSQFISKNFILLNLTTTICAPINSFLLFIKVPISTAVPTTSVAQPDEVTPSELRGKLIFLLV